MSYIDDVFGAAGLFARRFPDYEPRPGQIALARAIDDAFTANDHLLAEGPTGTGKGIAYAVPAMYHVATHQRRVLIVTANIALQEQLVTKDLPQLETIVPWQVSYALLKGKNNYLCLDRSNAELTQPTLKDFDDPDDVHRAIRQWATQTTTGDRSELPVHPSPALWRRFSVSSKDCKADDCAYRDDCFAYAARERAEDADILVTNYHMLFVHIQVRERTGMDLVLPSFDLLVCDEAHKAADIARDFFGYGISKRAIRWVGRQLNRLGESALLFQLNEAANGFYAALEALHDDRRRRLRKPDLADWRPLTDALKQTSWAYKRAMASEAHDGRRAMLRRLWMRAQVLAEHIESAMCLSQANMVTYLATIDDELTLCTKAVQVADRLQAGLFAAATSVVMTSATLSSHGQFTYIASELGLVQPNAIAVESPFDFARQALFVVPQDMPAPTADDYPQAVAQAIREIIDLADGRTLALFTSYKNLDACHAELAEVPYRVLKQGEAPRTLLVEEFRRDTRSVLLGTESFWSGVDVPGPSLSCVVIDRLPFPSPDDPVIDALSERNAQWFHSHSLPRAVIAFRQGVGRLIRSATDRGVVVLLDHRIVTKRYGTAFLRSLPPMLRSRRMENVRNFLAEGG
ncbi:MAG: ATP-dependent DNA helicase [Proteobacteria bacterium]|nr:ATP-dependent DNA helicase [Pseudomonadota bacterium]